MMLTNKKIIQILKVCAFTIFVGRAYQFIFFNAPFRSFLWDESLLRPILEGLFNTPWRDYVTSLTADKWIQNSVILNGVIYGIAAIAVIFLSKENRKYLKYPIAIGGFLLVVLSFLSAKEKFYHYGQFFEHAIQFGIPFLLLMANKGLSRDKIILTSKILIALTFTAHGLYALGYYPIPGYFIDMTINTLYVTEDIAVLILKIAGVMDIVLSIGIFLPKVAKYFLIYACVWGVSTALARVVSTINMEFLSHTLHQSIYLVVYRLSHGILPLMIALMLQKVLISKKLNLTTS
jgi:hypothetical protein